MLFNSLEFAIFFPVVCCLYFLVPVRMRVPVLLVASCVFYMAFIPAYILILFITIAIDYAGGIFMEKSEGRRRKAILTASIVATCAVLFVFKYFDFFTGNFVGLASFFGWELSKPAIQIILPVGLSFHTFQSLSYVIEVYRKRQKTERNFLTYATYVMFFPQLVAGPIERPQNLLHQFANVQPFDYERAVSGLKRMAWGFFKKLVVADRLAVYVNDVYGMPQEHNGLQLTLATVFFAYQIYCDFSGYSDIAIGSARVLGFRLMENFDTPYYSLSISEFWRRWHISLSTWFKDYLYVPLGGSRVSRGRWVFNIMVTFSVSGLWHGANWTYVGWGFLNGIYLVAGQFTKGARDRLFSFVNVSPTGWFRKTTMLVSTFALTCFAWVVFRASSMADAWYIWSHWARGWNLSRIATEHFMLRQLPVAVASILVLEGGQMLARRCAVSGMVSRLPLPARWVLYLGLLFTVVMFGVYQKTQFIYFQF